MTVEFVLVNEQQGTYVMVNLGKAGDDKTKAKRRSAPYPALGDYISWHTAMQIRTGFPRIPHGV